MNARIVQLAVGWVVLCALTSAGTYFGLLELDPQLGLQGKLEKILSPAPKLVPTPTPAPVVTPTPSPIPSLANPTPAPTGALIVTPTPYQPVVTPAPVVTQRPVATPTPAPPTPTPPPRPTPPVISGNLQTRFDDLNDRASQVISFFQQREQELRRMNQPLRADIKSAWRATVDYLTNAQRALRSGDGAGAQRNLDLAEQKIEFLEASK